MACIRTALALIGFGFGVGKFYGYLHDAGLQERLDPIRSTLSFGASFIVLAVLRVGAPAEVRLDTRREGESRSLRAMQ